MALQTLIAEMPVETLNHRVFHRFVGHLIGTYQVSEQSLVQARAM